MNVEPLENVYNFESFCINHFADISSSYFKKNHNLSVRTDLEGEEDYYGECLATLRVCEYGKSFLWHYIKDDLYLYDMVDNHTSHQYINIDWWEDFMPKKVYKTFIDHIFKPKHFDFKQFKEDYPNINENDFKRYENDFVIVPTLLREGDNHITFLILYLSNQLIQFGKFVESTDDYIQENYDKSCLCICRQFSKGDKHFILDPLTNYFLDEKYDCFETFFYPVGAIAQALKFNDPMFRCECVSQYIGFLNSFNYKQNDSDSYICSDYYKRRPSFYSQSKEWTIPEYLKGLV